MSKPVRFKVVWYPSIRYYVLNIPPKYSKTGKRAKLYFRDEKAAKKAAVRIRERTLRFGTSLRSLTPMRLGEAAEAYKLLDAHNKPYSLIAIIREHIAKEEQKNRSVSLWELFIQYAESILHTSVGHRKQIASVRERFKPLHKLMVSDIATEQLEPILAPLAGGTRNRYIVTLQALWNYAIRKEYTKANPVAKLDKVRVDKKPIQTFDNRVVQGKLNYALEHKPAMVPYFALGAFAGLRVDSGEMSLLRWEDIRFDEKTIVVRAEIAKTKQRRFIAISPNLEAWLKLVAPATGKGQVINLSHDQLAYARREIFHAVAGKSAKWIKAGLRHTFASNHLAFHNDINRLVLELGHQKSVDMLWGHYHLHTRKADAEAFWNIYPKA